MPQLVRPRLRPFIAGPADAPLVGALGRLFYLTAAQLTRLLYAPTSHTYTQARLKRLADAGYLQRIFLPRPTRTGSAPVVYTLARKGLGLLAEWGSPLDRRYRPAEVRETSYLYLAHTLALNDILIALALLCRRDRRVRIAALQHERELKLDPLRVRLPDGTTAGVIPDAWVDLRLIGARQRYQECYAIELDRGTTGQRAWRRKVAGLLAAAAGPYQQRFGTPSLTIAVVATPGARRRDELLRWTAAELQAAGRTDAAPLFRVASLPETADVPGQLWVGAGWRTPCNDQVAPLLELTGLDASEGSADP